MNLLGEIAGGELADLVPQYLQCSYNACMPAVTIRDVPDETRNTLAARAARNGQSLQEYLRGALVELAAQPDIAELMTSVRNRKSTADSSLPGGTILHHLRSDRR